MRARTFAHPFGVLGLCAAIGGCAADVPRRAAGPSVGEQGGSWEVVLPSAPSGPALAMGPESFRRDEALNARGEETLAYGDADRPSLDHARRLFLDERSDEFLYFRSPRQRRQSFWPGRW